MEHPRYAWSQDAEAVDRVAEFGAAWAALPPSHPRAADGLALLSALVPSGASTLSPRSAQAMGVWGGAPSPVRLAHLQRELDGLHGGRAVWEPIGSSIPHPDTVRSALAGGAPAVVGIHTFLPTGLGAVQPPSLPAHCLKKSRHAARALLLGNGAMARAGAGPDPVLLHQVVGCALVVFWPAVGVNAEATTRWGGLRHVAPLLAAGALRDVCVTVLHPGDCFFIPAAVACTVLALRSGDCAIAAQMRYSLVDKPREFVHTHPAAFVPAPTPMLVPAPAPAMAAVW